MRAKTFPGWKITDHKLRGEWGWGGRVRRLEITIAVSAFPGGQARPPRARCALFNNWGPTTSLHFLAKVDRSEPEPRERAAV